MCSHLDSTSSEATGSKSEIKIFAFGSKLQHSTWFSPSHPLSLPFVQVSRRKGNTRFLIFVAFVGQHVSLRCITFSCCLPFSYIYHGQPQHLTSASKQLKQMQWCFTREKYFCFLVSKKNVEVMGAFWETWTVEVWLFLSLRAVSQLSKDNV